MSDSSTPPSATAADRSARTSTTAIGRDGAPDMGEAAMDGADLNADDDLIHWKGPNDPENPFNFSDWKKGLICTIVCIHVAWVVMLSSAAAALAEDFLHEFEGITELQARLPVALFLFGFALGPLVLTPLAEDYGRKLVFTIAMTLVYVLQVPCALTNSFAGLVVCRFICGFAGSLLFNSVGNVPDMWTGTDPKGLWAMNGWAFSAEIIIAGPLIAGYITASIGWRWVFGVWGLVGAFLMIPFLLFVPETRGGVILASKARQARKSGHSKAWAIHEKLGRRSVGQIVQETVLRPAVMLLTEPIVYCFALYDGLNYAIIYLAIEAGPLVYEQYGLEAPAINLVLLAFVIGAFLAIPCFYFQLKAQAYFERREGRQNVPEHKLLWACVAAVLFPLSLYWFAWTSVPNVDMYVSLVALGVFAFASHILFLAVSDFTVESYGLMGSSAVTGQSFARENICAVISLVAVPFYQNVGYAWASTILAILGTVMAMFPFLFFKYGPVIRARSRYAQELAQMQEEEEKRSLWIEERMKKQENQQAGEGKGAVAQMENGSV